MPTIITDEAFIAAAKHATKLINDEIIATELGKLGHKIGDQVVNVSSTPTKGSLPGVGVIVGYQVISGIKYVLAKWEKETVACTRPESVVHSSYHSEIPAQRIWAFKTQDLLKKVSPAVNDTILTNDLAKYGLYPGQVVALNGIYEGATGVVVGIRNGNPILSIGLSHRDKLYSCSQDSQNLHSSYSRAEKYTEVVSTTIKGAKSSPPPAVNPPAKTPLQLKDEAVVAALTKANLVLGQTVYWKSSHHSTRPLLVVGHDGISPILAFNDNKGREKQFDIVYKKNQQDCLHSRYQLTEFPVFDLDKSNLETVTQRNEALAQKAKIIAEDTKIVEELRLAGLKVGDEVQYVISPTNEPQLVDPNLYTASNKSGTISKGTIVGSVAGSPIIRPDKLFPSAWGDERSAGSVHSTYSGKGYRFWAVHKGCCQKIATPAERAATASSRLAAIQAKFASKPFPEIAVEGLVIKKNSPIRADLKKAGYRIVAKQSLKLTHGVVCNLLKKKGLSNEKVEAIASALSTEYGKAAISMLMGYGIAYLPMMEDKAAIQGTKLEHLAILGEEFRIGGMTIAGNELVETIFKSALEVILNQEAEKKIRVSSEENTLLEEHLLEENSSIEDKKQSA